MSPYHTTRNAAIVIGVLLYRKRLNTAHRWRCSGRKGQVFWTRLIGLSCFSCQISYRENDKTSKVVRGSSAPIQFNSEKIVSSTKRISAVKTIRRDKKRTFFSRITEWPSVKRSSVIIGFLITSVSTVGNKLLVDPCQSFSFLINMPLFFSLSTTSL